MGSPGYVAERIWQAVDSLGEPEPSELRKHVSLALQQLVYLNGEDFEDVDDRASFETLMARATAFHASGEAGETVALSEQGTIADTVQLLPLADLQQLVQELLTLHGKWTFPRD